MRAAIHKPTIPATQTFVIKELTEQHFDPSWHAHSEYQLFVVLEGTGTRFIGDSIRSFKPGELILIGPHLPHLWRSDEKYFSKGGPDCCKGLVIYLDEHFLGQDVLKKDEMHRLKTLFEKSMKGLEFYGSNKVIVIELMKELVHQEGLSSLIHLLRILDILSTTKEYHYISSKTYHESFHERESDRLNIVYEYLIRNYRSRIPLERVASMVHMTPTSFSRYFAMKNNKTYSRFISEIRIKHACELLTNSDMSVAEICFECGYNTLSNFNRQFLEIVGKKPTEYKREFMNL